MTVLQAKIARKYAKSLFSLLKREELDIAVADLKNICSIREDGEAFQNIADNPTLTYQQKSDCLDLVLNSLQLKTSTVANLSKLLLLNQRFDYINLIKSEFDKIIDSMRKSLHVRISTVNEMTFEEKNIFESKIKETTQGLGSATFLIDSSLLGGAKIQIGDSELDTTLSFALAKLEQNLSQ